MELKILQRQFYNILQEKQSVNGQELGSLIKAAQTLSYRQGLEIYQGSIIGQLSRTMKIIYPVCLQLVGEDFFEYLVANYIDQFPSISPDLGEYGQHFPKFLKTFDPVFELPYLSDIALLEWGWYQVFHGEKETILDIEKLGQINPSQWNEVIFYLPKNSILIESSYPIYRIWEVNQPNYKGEDLVNLDEGGCCIFIRRNNYEIQLELPNEIEWKFLNLLENNQTLEVICNQLENGASLLSEFVQRGWIESFSLG